MFPLLEILPTITPMFGCGVVEALTAASLIIGATSTTVSYVGQNRAANAQKRQQAQLSELEAQRQREEALQLRQRQAIEAESRANELNKVSKEALRQRATAVTSAGEAGISGISVDTLLNDYAAQEAAIYSQSQRQAQLDNLYTEQQLAASRLGSNFNQARINAPINRPSALAAALSIGASGVDALGSYATNPSRRYLRS